MLILASFIGGCAGSTAGGMKVLRWLLIFKQGWRELARLLHPNAEIPVRLGEIGACLPGSRKPSGASSPSTWWCSAC
jgi:hypothetical protein